MGYLIIQGGLSHNRINNWRFYALKNIINDDLISNTSAPVSNTEIIVYPNPTRNKLYFKNIDNFEVIDLELFDNLGKFVLKINSNDFKNGVDISGLQRGIYYLKVKGSSFVETIKVIKN